MTQEDWLYHFDKKGDIVRNEKILNAIPKLSALDDKSFKYYVLAYDHVRSPYKFRPESDAKLMAARLSFGIDKIPDEDQDVIRELRSVIYDEKHETVINIRKKIKLLNEKIISEEDFKELKAIMTTIDKLQEMQDSLMEEIKEKSESVKLGKGKTLSLLEQMRHNKKLFDLKSSRDV